MKESLKDLWEGYVKGVCYALGVAVSFVTVFMVVLVVLYWFSEILLKSLE